MSCVPLLLLFPGATDVFVILLLNVFAAFCAAEKTVEKKPPELGVVAPLSSVGVKGADVIFDNLLGTNVFDPERIRRCEIMFPDGDVTTLVFVLIGSGGPRSRLEENRGELVSVGVGGVLTIIGAGFSVAGGVLGGALVSIVWILAVCGRSGEDTAEGCGEACRSANMFPTLDTTLPRLLSTVEALSFSFNPAAPPPPAFRSGLVLGLGLGPRFEVRAFFNLPTGDGLRCEEPFVGACRVVSTSDGADSEAARLSRCTGNVEARGVGTPSSWASCRLISGTVVE